MVTDAFVFQMEKKIVIKEFGGNRKAFLAKYPYRFSPDEEGVTESEFITNPVRFSITCMIVVSVLWLFAVFILRIII